MSKLVNFITQILIVRYLSQSSYGGFAYALAVVALIQSIVTLGLDRSITRFLPIFHEQRDRPRLFGTILMAVLVILSLGLVAVLGLHGLQGLVGQWVHDERALALLLILVFLAPLQALDELSVGIFAVFVKPRSIFFRRHILAPGLQLLVVVALILTRQDVLFLAFGYVAATLLGLAIYSTILFDLLRDQGLFHDWSPRDIVMPWRQVFGFTLPLLTTELVYVTMNTVNVVLLERFGDLADVAMLRAVQPVAKLNEFVMMSFALLFTPVASRMFATDDREGINTLYWRTAVWIAIFSFPVFILTFSLAQPITLLLFGLRYQQSAPILALLSIGYYFNAALGFNGLTLKVFGKVRYIVFINLATAAVAVTVSLLLIPRSGALGAGISIMVALVVHNLFKQAGLRLVTGVKLFERSYLRTYGAIAVAALALLALQLATSAPVYVSLGLAALTAFILMRLNIRTLGLSEMFPEAMKVPLLRLLMSGRWTSRVLPGGEP